MQNKHKCKLCSKSFCNGRALGGHMKSHLVSSQPQTRKKLGDSVYSSSSSSDGKSLVYGLRENPRKSFRVFNPDPESSTVYNSETETEPESGDDPVKKRVRAEVSKKKKKKKSKRVFETGKKQKTSHESPEPAASSVSDGSPEPDLAMCLMMLSRDSRELEMKLKKPVFAAEVVEENMQWSRICLLLVRYSFSMRFHQFQLPQYEDFRLIIRFNRSFARMAVMCLKEKHSNQSLDYIVSGFSVNLYGSDYLSDRFDGDSVFPCIEGSFRLVLTVFVAKGLVPSISFGIYCVVVALWEGLCFTEGDVSSNSIRESSEWNEAFVPPPSSSRINSSFCRLGMFFQEAGTCVAPKHLSIRPYVLSAIITEVLLALRCVLDSAVETVINLLKVFSNIQTLFGLIHSKVSRIKFSGSIHEISLFMCPFDPISYPFRSFSLNVVVVVELSTPTLLFVSSSFNGA